MNGEKNKSDAVILLQDVCGMEEENNWYPTRKQIISMQGEKRYVQSTTEQRGRGDYLCGKK